MRGAPLGLLRPDRYHSNVHSIDPAALAAEGFEAVLVDLDNTLVPRKSPEIPDASRFWAQSVLDAGLLGCLVSNNWHGTVSAVAEQIGFTAVPRALKPLPMAFRRACDILGVEPHRSLVVGDQVFTDVLGGNLVGATTALVIPLAGSDLPHTRLLRWVEAAIMAGREPLGEPDGRPRKEPTA